MNRSFDPMGVQGAASHSPWRTARSLAIAAAASSILLTGVSAWFLGAVALAGLGPAAYAFNFHIPAAMVRLFALTRTAAKYGERVVGHRAALLDQVTRRAALFTAMAATPAVRAAGWQLGNQDRLADYMDDVEDVDYARLRVGMPAATLAAGGAALTAATAWLTPMALLPIGAAALVLSAVAWAVLPRIAGEWAVIRNSRRAAGRRIGAALASVVPLRAEGTLPGVLGGGFARYAEAEAAGLRQRRLLALLDAVAALVGPTAALAVLAAAWQGGSRSTAPLLPAFVAFAWVAFGEHVHGLSRMMFGRVRARTARSSIGGWTYGAQEGVTPVSAGPFTTLMLNAVRRQAPDGRALGGAVSLTLRAGSPVALTGPSGSGKTTLLKQIAGWLGDDPSGAFTADGLVLGPAAREELAHLGLHDAAVLSDSVRENLFAPDATDEECWQALEVVELATRIAAAGGLDAWISQDMLSLGEAQRLNLARALLSRAPIVLLDEPTEHLDVDQARRVLQQVLERLSDRIVLYVTHGANAAGEAAQLRRDIGPRS